MSYKVVAITKMQPGKMDEGIQLGSSAASLLREQLGFISLEVVKTGEDNVIAIQTWQTKNHYAQAMSKIAGNGAAASARQEMIASREVHAGEVVLES